MKERYKRIIAVFFALNILFEVISPTVALALTGGPSQPEVQSFTPVGTSDMVNLFSGDFNYNIPLLDVDGYPVNLAYTAGSSADQEASWVGLGWNMNPGTVNRGMRGLPDDFKGDLVHKEINMKANQTFGASFGLGFELFGKDKKDGLTGSLNFNLGLNFNTYAGYGMDMSSNFAVAATKNNTDAYGGSLGIHSGTGKGLGISANLSYSKSIKDKEDGNRSTTSKNASLGLNYNTASGLNSLSFKYSASRSTETNFKRSNGENIVDTKSIGPAANFGYSFASPTYMPSSGGPEMVNLGLNLSVTFGLENVGGHPKATIGAYYSGQFIKDNTKDYEAYGYMHSEFNNSFGSLENSSGKMHDFNREKDAGFTLNTPNLPVTNYSFDSFNYTGQGISGDFRPHRNHVGTVFDPYVKNFPSMSLSSGVELGAANVAHVGLNAEMNFSRTKTGKWTGANSAEILTLFNGGNNGFNESIYFQQGGEKTAETDMDYFNNVISGFKPVRLGLQKAGPEAYLTNVLTTKYLTTKLLTNNKRNARVRRNESVNVLTAANANLVGLETGIKDYPLNNFGVFYGAASPSSISRTSGNAYKLHHISEISTLRDDGARYVYGIPVYNKKQKDATFAIEPGSNVDYEKGLAPYSGTDNSINNTKGLDKYFDSQEMPGYAHSFLLTAVLSSDYVDKTLDGPTKDDLGKYTKFNYTRHKTDFKWRTPVAANKASVNQALYSSTGASGDDKASYSYGEKEIWYLHSIETKNYVAVFELEDRLDALGVTGENGGKDVTQKLKRLKEIRLYTKQEFIDNQGSAVPLKTVHFEYDYTLCQGIDNNVYDAASPNPVPTEKEGKLTLKKVYFTYQNSMKGKLSPYQFEYNTVNSVTNYTYNPKSYDRWGNYKPNAPPGGYSTNSSSNFLLTSEFPYSEQDKAKADLYASAWNLSKITLPSGAELNVAYEADDYGYVQDKKAMQMFTLHGAGNVMNSSNFATPNSLNTLYDTSPDVKNDCMYLNISPEDTMAVYDKMAFTGMSKEQAIKELFFKDENGVDIENLYFKFLINVERNMSAYNKKFEYVSGYAKINFATDPTLIGRKLAFKVKAVQLYDNVFSNVTTHPVSMAGINFVRRYMPQITYDNYQDPFTSVGSNLLALANSMKGAFTPLVQIFKGGIANALRLSHASQLFVPNRSFVRLYSGRQFKKGGGHRVKQLLLIDKWSQQSANPVIADATYGQTYDYVTKHPSGTTISSGVASYEPLIGGDENPHRQPLFYSEPLVLAPDEDYYHETPYGESMFPGPSVGYSRVVTRNLKRTDGTKVVSRHATGAIVNEFYTAKDFPTKTDRTDVKKERHKPNPVAKFMKFFVRDYMTTSQGYQVVLNDMHGKQKAQWVYKEGNPDVLLSDGTYARDYSVDQYYGNNYISGIEYKYKRLGDDLSNDAPVIEKNGQISMGMVGVDYDMVVDTRESKTTTRNGSLQGNLETFILPIFPLAIPSLYPGYSQEKIRYRSCVVTKLMYRYGLLDEVIAYENGSKVSTKNSLWDAETGQVLLTQTTNKFNDPVYNLTYPAHWAYDRMGQASKNIGAQSLITTGVINTPNILAVGDEVVLTSTLSSVRGWVKTTLPTVQIINNAGAPIGLSSYASLTITRSGYRNEQNLPVAQLASMASPLLASGSATNLTIDKSTKIISASATEYKDSWGMFCNCGTTSESVINPFLTGQSGIFRPYASYVYLTGREQNKINDNTSVRKDGPYLSFVPFWSANPNSSPYDWTKTSDPAWQFTSKTTLFSPYGFELENIDPLNRNSAALYGYNNSLPTAVSSNARYSQIGFDGFEDYDYNQNCENHFGFIKYYDGSSNVVYNKSTNNYISKSGSQNQKYSHTGRKSVKITNNTFIITAPVTSSCNSNVTPPIIY